MPGKIIHFELVAVCDATEGNGCSHSQADPGAA